MERFNRIVLSLTIVAGLVFIAIMLPYLKFFWTLSLIFVPYILLPTALLIKNGNRNKIACIVIETISLCAIVAEALIIWIWWNRPIS